MKLIGLKRLTKLKKKNIGNKKLIKAVDQLINDIKDSPKGDDLIKIRTDADCIHGDGFYFFDMNIHRTMILLEYVEEDDDDDNVQIANVIWVGSHDEYERTFKNNKDTIYKWLKGSGYIN